jgi:hypothetical protein
MEMGKVPRLENNLFTKCMDVFFGKSTCSLIYPSKLSIYDQIYALVAPCRNHQGKKTLCFNSLGVQKSDFIDEERKSNSLRVEGDLNDIFFFSIVVGHTVRSEMRRPSSSGAEACGTWKWAESKVRLLGLCSVVQTVWGLCPLGIGFLCPLALAQESRHPLCLDFF